MLWSEDTWFGQIVDFQTEHDEIELKKISYERYFSDVIIITSPKNVTKQRHIFPFCPAWTLGCPLISFFFWSLSLYGFEGANRPQTLMQTFFSKFVILILCGEDQNLFLKITQKRKELGCQHVLWTDRKHGFLNRLVQKLRF